MGERKGALISKGNIFPLYLWLFSLGCTILLWFFYCCCDLRLRRLLSSNTNQICKAPSKQQEGRRGGGKKKFWGQSSPLPRMPLVFGCLLLEPGHVSTLVTHGNPDLPRQPRPGRVLSDWSGEFCASDVVVLYLRFTSDVTKTQRSDWIQTLRVFFTVVLWLLLRLFVLELSTSQIKFLMKNNFN